ncbi:MAG: hypothetical protein HFH36_14660 [Lachnospiraceae bacterium]|jgi:uncharacterized phage protein (TIGR01671 family)|nr:hypothetical protein [Lachnospiraceae bacterium]
MREILFRGKSVLNGEWLFGNFLKTDDGVFVIQNFDPFGGLAKYEVDHNAVCQYTGLTDKNGRKIFEGDIISKKVNVYKLGETAPCGERMLIGSVIWDDSSLLYPGNWSLQSKDERGNNATYTFDNEYEIIGNIFDNSELIGGQP